MRLHEYQAKEILAKAGCAVPAGRVARTPAEAAEAAEALAGRVVVKAQVHAGGRGKAGGVKLAASAAEARDAAASMLGSTLVTPQTGLAGVPVDAVLVEEALEVDEELYAAIAIDGAEGGAVVMVSAAGGMEIEEVAERTPEKIIRAPVDPVLGLMPYQIRKLANGLGVDSRLMRPVSGMLERLYSVFSGNDCSLVEVNPLVITTDGAVLAADAKLDVDDDALFRRPDLLQMRDPGQEDPLEAQARSYGISYVKLDGAVGCLVNGAGLAMATMDVTDAAGASPANFLDVGGSADVNKVAQAMGIILSDPNVETVLINIFGGILRCDLVSEGVLEAARAAPGAMRPMVVRMQGTNAEEGRALLAESGLAVTLVDDMAQAADAVRAQPKGSGLGGE